MMRVNCKQCGCIIHYEYSPIESLNCKKELDKYLSKLEQHSSEGCSTSIYLTCENNHIDKYFCKIETK